MQTAEELIVSIRKGDRELIPVLWQQMSGVIRSSARRYMATHTCCGCGLDDLTQSGFVGLLYAVDHFQQGRGMSFKGFLCLALQNFFRSSAGFHPGRKQPRDPLDLSQSLDAPAGDEDADSDSGETLADLLPGTDNTESLYEEREKLEIIRRVLRAAIKQLPELQQAEMWLLAAGDPPENRKAKDTALRTLRGMQKVRELRCYLD